MKFAYKVKVLTTLNIVILIKNHYQIAVQQFAGNSFSKRQFSFHFRWQFSHKSCWKSPNSV